MKRKKLKVTKVPILNSEYSVYILQGKKEKAFSWIKSYYGKSDISINDFEGFRGRVFYHHGYFPVIYLISTRHKYATLAHEAVHAINYIWEDIGEKCKEEVYAHSVGAIVFAIENKGKKRT